MPEALATTKRKFYKVLDTLNAPAPPHPSSNAAPAPKRLRPALPLQRSTAMRSLAPSTPAPKPAALPPFCPWSHDGFLARLRTFAPVTTWLPKPDERVAETHWARRGWSCVGPETVGCGACGRRVGVDFSPVSSRGDADDDGLDFQDAFERGLVERYALLVVDGHADTCPWRRAVCGDDIYRVPVVRTAWWQDRLRVAVSSVLALDADEVASLNVRDVDAAPSAARILADLPPGFLATATNGIPPTPRALAMALTGWRATVEANTALLTCDACFQRVGLWLHRANADADAAVALDLVRQHREHCPFRNAAAQAATGAFAAQPAWRIFWTTAARWAAEQRRRSGGSVAASLLAPSDADTETVAEANGTRPDVETCASDAHVDGENESLDTEGGGGGAVHGTGSARRIEVARLDRERSAKLRRLKQALGIKVRVPVVETRRERARVEAAAAAAAAAAGTGEDGGPGRGEPAVGA